jgi:hypothetical protein
MKTFWVFALLGVAGFAAYKYAMSHQSIHGANLTGGFRSSNVTPNYDPAGVPSFDDTAAPNKPDQVLAASQGNSAQVSESGFSPAFGPDENQPGAYDEVPF